MSCECAHAAHARAARRTVSHVCPAPAPLRRFLVCLCTSRGARILTPALDSVASASVSKRKRETGPLDDAAFDFDPSVVCSPGLGGKLDQNMADLFAGVAAPTASPVKMVPPPVK